MEHKIEKLDGNKVKLAFTVAAEKFEEALQAAYLKARSRIAVPGFRKGKAPRKLIERMYGEGVFYDDAFEVLFPEVYIEAVKANDLKPVSQPEISSVDTMEKGKDLVFTCEVFVEPEVKLGDYMGIEVERPMHQVSEDELKARIEQDQKRNARIMEITDRAVENGDKVGLDYSGSVDGVKFDGGTAQNQTLVIGSNTFIPGFEPQLVGMKIGEEKDITVKFPDDYHAEELKGKEAIFHVKINSITHEELPELDDDFASEVSEFDTFAQYQDDLKSKLQKAADDRAIETAKNSLIQKITENAEIDIPAPMVESKLDEMLEQMGWRMQQQGFTMKKYMELTGMNESQMRDMYREEAKNNLKTELVIDEIVKKEEIKAADEEIDKLLTDYASAMGQTLDQLKQGLSDSQKDYFAHRAAVTKALDQLWDGAKVKDVAEAAAKEDKAEKPAKKPATKKATKAKAEDKADDKAEVKAKAPAKAEAKDDAEEKPAKKPAVKKPAAKKAKATEDAAKE